MADRLRRDTPPRVGPYGRAEQVGGRWVVRLTEEGKAVVTEWLAGVNDLVAWFARCHPKTVTYARAARMTCDEIDAACRRGVCLAVAKWRPDDSALSTTAPLWMRKAVQRDAETHTRCYRQTGHSESSIVAEAVASPHVGTARHDDRAERKRRVLDELKRLPERDRLMFGMVHGLADGEPLTLREVGEVYGVSHQRVQQVCKRVAERLADAVRGAT